MYRPILASLGFILSKDKQSVLLVHRNKRDSDRHLGKYNGLGGKMESGEDALSCLRREVEEEAGLRCLKVELRGTINWPGIGGTAEDWFGFIFLVHEYAGRPPLSNEEGDLSWESLRGLASLPMWEGDKYFLPLVFDGNPSPFYGHMRYEKKRVMGWHYSRA